MIFQFLFGRTKEEPYKVFTQDGIVEHPNPLTTIAPKIFTTPEIQEMREMPERIEFMEKTVTDTLHALRIPPSDIKDVIIHNCRMIITTPTIYALNQTLRKQKLARYIENSHVMATLIQVACMMGDSGMARQIRDSLMPVLLGVYVRFYGITFMRANEVACLRNFRRFDMDDARERELRDAFLESLKNTMTKIANTSAERFAGILSSKLKGVEANQAIALEHIIRYSSRLSGRTAIELNATQETDIHHLTAYVGVAYALASAYISTGKRFPILFAESLMRGKSYRQRGGFEATSRHNLFALEDLMLASRCIDVPFFQGEDVTAFYSIPDNIFVVPIDDMDGNILWQCFWGPKRKIAFNERGQSQQDCAKNVRIDPTGEELVPADNILPAPGEKPSSRSTRRYNRMP